MEFRDLQDGHGGSLRVLDYNGYFLPAVEAEYVQREFPNIPNWKCRDDDVLLCCFSRSGTHWMWEIISMVLAKKAERIQGVKQEMMMEFMEEREFDSKTSPRVLNTHIYYNQLPEDFKRRKCKIILCIRNPKDVMVSLFNLHTKLKLYKMSMKWENYIRMFLEGQIDYGSWFEYVLGWERVIKENPDAPIHVVYYEDMKMNGIEEIRKMAEFFGKEGDEQLYRDINALCQFDKMKEEKNKGATESWVDNTPDWYRKGLVGDWKTWLTVAQNEYFDQIYDKNMIESNLKIKFEI